MIMKTAHEPIYLTDKEKMMKRKSFRPRFFLLPLFPLYLLVYFMYNSAPDDEAKVRVSSETPKVEAVQTNRANESSIQKNGLSNFHHPGVLANSVEAMFLPPEHFVGAAQNERLKEWQEDQSPESDHVAQ